MDKPAQIALLIDADNATAGRIDVTSASHRP